MSISIQPPHFLHKIGTVVGISEDSTSIQGYAIDFEDEPHVHYFYAHQVERIAQSFETDPPVSDH